MIDFLKKYFEKKILLDLKWKYAIISFSFYGTFIFFLAKQDVIFSLNSTLISSKILAVYTIGLLIGNIFGFSISYLIKYTSRVFNCKINFKDIAKVFTIAYKPHFFSIILVAFCILGNHYFNENGVTPNQFYIELLSLLIYIAFSVISIFSLIIQFYGLMFVLNLDLIKTIVTFILASLLFSPGYYLLIKLI